MTEPTFRVIPPDNRGYSGLTALRISETRELVAMGTGPEVERMLKERAGRG